MSGYETATDRGFLLASREWKVIGGASALMLLNVLVMYVFVATPLAVVNDYLFAVPILGVVVYGAAIMGGELLAELLALGFLVEVAHGGSHGSDSKKPCGAAIGDRKAGTARGCPSRSSRVHGVKPRGSEATSAVAGRTGGERSFRSALQPV